MKLISIILLESFIVYFSNAQNEIGIPDTISGSEINISLKENTRQFFSNTQTKTLGYDEKYLGKTLILRKGDNVRINVHNQLSETTSTHWHGLHVAPKNDGSPHLPIPAGATWSPEFTVMDKAALYWYHPHLHGITQKQVLKGAAGLIIVKDEEEAALTLPRTYGVDDIPLVLQFQTFDLATKQIIDNDDKDNTILVNGTVDGFLKCPAQVVRLRLLNASSRRIFQLGFDNNLSFYQIASDDGLLDKPISMTRLMLSPGERAEILVNLSNLEGKTILVKTFGNELPSGYAGGPAMGMMGGSTIGPLDNTVSTVFQLKVATATSNAVVSIPTLLTKNIRWNETESSQTRLMTLSGTPMMNPTNFYINNRQFDESIINFTSVENKIEMWSITNQSMMAHPFHIHGNHFYIVSINGNSPAPNLQGRKDVVLVPPMGGNVKLITKYEDFTDSELPYMYHCHILSHEDNGMMGQFLVKSSTTANVETDSLQLVLYPNPAHASISIEGHLKSQAPIFLSVVNSVGQQVFSEKYEYAEKWRTLIPCENWGAGAYILQFSQGTKHVEKKFIKH